MMMVRSHFGSRKISPRYRKQETSAPVFRAKMPGYSRLLTTSHSWRVNSHQYVYGGQRQVRFFISLNIHDIVGDNPLLVAGCRVYYDDGESRWSEWSGWIGSWTILQSPDCPGHLMVWINIAVPGTGGGLSSLRRFPLTFFRPCRTIISQRQLGDNQQQLEESDGLGEWTVLDNGYVHV